jgi:hypothetical protein
MSVARHMLLARQEVRMIPMVDGMVPGVMAMHLVVDPAAVGAAVALLGMVVGLVAGVARELRAKTPVVRVGALAPVAA